MKSGLWKHLTFLHWCSGAHLLPPWEPHFSFFLSLQFPPWLQNHLWHLYSQLSALPTSFSNCNLASFHLLHQNRWPTDICVAKLNDAFQLASYITSCSICYSALCLTCSCLLPELPHRPLPFLFFPVHYSILPLSSGVSPNLSYAFISPCSTHCLGELSYCHGFNWPLLNSCFQHGSKDTFPTSS